MKMFKDARLYAAHCNSTRFRTFARIGRWGTCADCPRDNDGQDYPEFCANTDRYDHDLTLAALNDALTRDLHWGYSEIEHGRGYVLV